MKHFDRFDAVRVVGLPQGRRAMPTYYSQTGTKHIKIGDIGVVIGGWSNNKYRVEAVNSDGAIVWQDHFEAGQLQLLPPTAATFSRRRIHEHWAYRLGLGQELLDDQTRQDALTFARKVMAFARHNVELLIERLERSGYSFASPDGPRREPEEDLATCFQELADRGVHVPVALQAWLMEVGSVDLSGTHPAWLRTGYSGLGDDKSHSEPWYTDPLVIWLSPRSLLQWREQARENAETHWLEIAPDVVTKANVSGGAPVSVDAGAPRFDPILVGQHGSYTLLSYLRWAFAWSGFPGFDYIPDAPVEMLKELGRELVRL
jgi:hypothetical protein